MKKFKILLTSILIVGLFNLFSVNSLAKSNDYKNKASYKIHYYGDYKKLPIKVKISDKNPTNKSVKIIVDLTSYGKQNITTYYFTGKEKARENLVIPTPTKSKKITRVYKENTTNSYILNNKYGETIAIVDLKIDNIDKISPKITLLNPVYHEETDMYMVRFKASDIGSGVKYIYKSGSKTYLGKSNLSSDEGFDAKPGSYVIKVVDNVGNVTVKTINVSKKDYENRRELNKL